MKIALNRDQKGQALILVLILLLLGALIITPFLSFMSTGLTAGRVQEERMYQFYAADAGIEEAIYNIIYPKAPHYTELQGLAEGESISPYTLAEMVNGKDVTIEITKVYDWNYEGSSEDFLEGLLGEGKSPPCGHEDWFQIETSITPSASTEQLKYTIEITYQGEDEIKKLKGLGAYLAWPEGEETNYWGYVDKSAHGITDDYPPTGFEVTHYEEGTYFRWTWPKGKPPYPSFTIGETKTQTFEFIPAQPPLFHFGWVEGHSADIDIIYISSDFTEEFTIWKTIATATDLTDKQTEVIAYVSRKGDEGAYAVEILTWESSVQ